MADSRYLRPLDLQRLRRLTFASRRAVDSARAGRHLSARRGQGVEFADYRAYAPGDAPADVDWKAFGRSDRLFVKLHEHESDMAVQLLLDASASMVYPAEASPPPPGDASGQHVTKFDYACLIAAAIAFLSLRQQDRVGLAIAQQGLHAALEPRTGATQLDALLATLEAARPTGRADLPRAITELAARGRPRGPLVVLSDLYEEPAEIFRALAAFTGRGGEVMLLHVLHADELSLPAGESLRFIDSEDGRRIDADSDAVRVEYEAALRAFVQRWSDGCRQRSIGYQLVGTREPYLHALQRFLQRSGS